jgi:exopolysaccharide production protein ExoQ
VSVHPPYAPAGGQVSGQASAAGTGDRIWPAVRPGRTAVIVFVMFGGLLFILQLGARGPLIGMAMAGLLLVTNRQARTGLFGPRSYVFVLPGLCLLSAAWSEDPFGSFRAGLEMTVTLGAGVILSLVDRRKEMLAGVAAAFVLYNFVAFKLGHFVGVGTAEAAFSGLNEGKNFMAEIASTGVVASLGLAAAAVGERRVVWLAAVAAALVAAAFELYILYLARSAGAVIALGLGLITLSGLIAVSRLSVGWRGAAAAAAAVALAVIGVFREPLARQVSDLAIRAFDKDPTLTGRTYLWYRAHQMIAEKPWLGHGFDAFWRQGNPDAEGLWRFAGITLRAGFNFHNTGIELLMQFGWCGAVFIVLVTVAGVALLVRRFVLRPDLMTCFWLALVVFELTRSFYETIFPIPFYFSNVLLAAAFASAFRTPELVAAPRS